MSAVYDGAFRAIVNDCKRMLLPLLNEVFDEEYKGDEQVELHPNEYFIDQQDKPDQRRITDTNFCVKGKKVKKGRKNYHIECESGYPKAGMIIRMFEYDAQIAQENRETVGETVTFTFPHSVVVYLRSRRNTPDRIRLAINTPGGRVEYTVPLLKLREYTLEELFRKRLYMLIPFYVFFWEDEFEAKRRSPTLAKRMKTRVEWMLEELLQLEEKGEISGVERSLVLSNERSELLILKD